MKWPFDDKLDELDAETLADLIRWWICEDFKEISWAANHAIGYRDRLEMNDQRIRRSYYSTVRRVWKNRLRILPDNVRKLINTDVLG